MPSLPAPLNRLFSVTGMHLLEVAKTAWNCSVQTDPTDKALNNLAQEALMLARSILTVFGSEGDEYDGPLVEIQTLSNLLSPLD